MGVRGKGLSGGYFGQKMEFHLSSLLSAHPSIASTAVNIAFRSENGQVFDGEYAVIMIIIHVVISISISLFLPFRLCYDFSLRAIECSSNNH